MPGNALLSRRSGVPAMCAVLDALANAVATVPELPSPAGLGAVDVLTGQVAALGSAVAVLQRELALRMAALEAQGPAPTDVRGEAAAAGVGSAQAAALRRQGVFAAEHPQVRHAWEAESITADQVSALRDGAAKLPEAQLRRELIEAVLPHLPDLDLPGTRQAVAAAVDALQPGDPDGAERRDHASRRLAWSDIPGGGIVLDGYLPAFEGEAFKSAIKALAEGLRCADDGLTTGQRRADALAALVARATEHGLPTGGGLPAALMLTVSLKEAERVASRDPSQHGDAFQTRQRSGATAGSREAGDAAVRFGLCCADITPVLTGRQPTGLLGRIANTPTEPLAVGRSVRLATRAQRRALRLRDGGCVIPGCAVAADYTQPHHVTPWSLDGDTDLDNLVSLCFVHHRLVELGNWTLRRRRPGDPEPHPQALAHPSWWILPRAR